MEEKSLREFTEMLAAKTSVPGGGGACAAVGAIAIALGNMVGQYTVGKKAYADVEEDITKLMERAEETRVELLECIDKDAEAFEPLSQAYSLPKDDPNRDEIMEECLQRAANVPVNIMRILGEALEILEELAEKGSKIVISDAATAAILCKAAMQAAAVNVKVNTKLMKDARVASATNDTIEGWLNRYIPMADKIYESIMSRYDRQ
jgi:formiminotetrahydrofolate cyclodeaminase